MKNVKKSLVFGLLVAMALQMFVVRVAGAAGGSVVINEVAWAGSADSSTDEWIELYNDSPIAVDLSGWFIEDDGGASVYLIESGEIAPYGYFLIEDSETVTSADSDALIGLSLANTGDSLVLKNSSGTAVDSVDSGGMWFAGDGTSKASMERVDPGIDGSDAENWASCVMGNGTIASGGSSIFGTPGSANSNYAGGIGVSAVVSDSAPSLGDILAVSIRVDDVVDLYSFGMDLNYDSAVLEFLDASEGELLGNDGETTSFNYGLLGGDEGTLVVGDVRITDPISGIDGDGELFNASFRVVGEDESNFGFGNGSFLADVNGDLPVSYSGAEFSVGAVVNVGSVENIVVENGDARYSLELSWEAPASGADSYVVKKLMPNGEFAAVAYPEFLSFIDSGGLVPGVEYEYEIIPVLGGAYGPAESVVGVEARGVTGDNDRNDRVDGRDLDGLARAYGTTYGEDDYDLLLDTTYDGLIDGNDLIDIGANFAQTY